MLQLKKVSGPKVREEQNKCMTPWTKTLTPSLNLKYLISTCTVDEGPTSLSRLWLHAGFWSMWSTKDAE